MFIYQPDKPEKNVITQKHILFKKWGEKLKFSMIANSMSQQHNAPPKQVMQSLVTLTTVFPYKGHQIPRLGLGYGVEMSFLQ